MLILTASTERNAVIEAVAAGADGYLQKFTGTEQLLATVRDVAKGEYRMPRDVMKRVFRRLRNMPEQSDSPRRPGLTEREKEILTQFAKGMSYSAIAESRGNRLELDSSGTDRLMLDAKPAAIAFGGTFTGASTQLYKTGNYRLATPKGSHYNSSDLRRTAGLQHRWHARLRGRNAA